jgi:hypothetical protein
MICRALRVFAAGIMIVAAAAAAAAQDELVNSGAKFLAIGGGARALALAETYAAETGDPFSLFYNPAAAAGVLPARLGLAHNEHFQHAHGEYIAVTMPYGKWGAGVGLQYMAVNDIPQRIGPSSEPLAYFDAADFMLQASISYQLAPRARVGVSGKGVFEKIGSEVANGVAFDLGGIVDISNHVQLGAALNNLGPEMSFNNSPYKLPGLFRLGGTYRFPKWSVRSELVSQNNESATFHLGGEYLIAVSPEEIAPVRTSLSLRAGYVFGHDTRSWAAGVGIGIDRLGIDYAFVPYSDDLGNTHRFGLRFDL